MREKGPKVGIKWVYKLRKNLAENDENDRRLGQKLLIRVVIAT
jgi:hypothetical protein